MFWTTGWAAILGFSSGLAGIAGGSITAALSQRSTTKREVMLAQRAWNEKLYVDQREAIADVLLSCGDAYQLLIDNLGELIRVIGTNTISTAQDRAVQRSLIDRLENESAENAKIRQFVSVERIEPLSLPDQVTSALRETIPRIHKRMVILDLLIADGDLKNSLEALKKSWSDLAKSWYETTAIARESDSHKLDDISMPELKGAMQRLTHWVSCFGDFDDAARKYLVRGIGK